MHKFESMSTGSNSDWNAGSATKLKLVWMAESSRVVLMKQACERGQIWPVRLRMLTRETSPNQFHEQLLRFQVHYAVERAVRAQFGPGFRQFGVARAT
jgi:hypothetical protein